MQFAEKCHGMRFALLIRYFLVPAIYQNWRTYVDVHGSRSSYFVRRWVLKIHFGYFCEIY
jgi:hypothetical protein